MIYESIRFEQLVQSWIQESSAWDRVAAVGLVLCVVFLIGWRIWGPSSREG